MASFEFVSFTLGLLLGMIIFLLFIWISYYTRTFLFTYCSTQSRPCGGADYYSDPGDGLINNPQIAVDDILFLNDSNEMFYKRVQKNTDCMPESNQLVYMKYPQYCSFSTEKGIESIWKETSFNSNIYRSENGSDSVITTEGNCVPISKTVSGNPLLKWESNPFS